MRKGLFRTKLPGLGECARVDMSAGDAAPYLERDMYVLLGFQPGFEQLPAENHLLVCRRDAERRVDLLHQALD